MILLLDHDDSFVFTLASYVQALGENTSVVRAHGTSLENVIAQRPDRIILSPGPRSPAACPLAIQVVQQLGATIPILGVCLGHQCIAAAFGATVGRAKQPRHGMTSPIRHDGAGVFRGIPSPVLATRYHSLSVSASTLPSSMVVSATADDGEVMGIRHQSYRIEGVQFHPESILTECGTEMVANFLAM